MGELLTTVDEDGLELQSTEHVCPDCGEELAYTDEVWRLIVVQFQHIRDESHCYHIVNDTDPDGDFLFEPMFFCFKCWENMYNEVEADITEADTEAVEDIHSKVLCDCCDSGIRDWEYASTFVLGEFHKSRRAPNNVRGPRFVETGKQNVLCLACLTVINEHFIALWEELSQNGECVECIGNRCWRYNTCSCDCHTEDHGEENE